MEYAVGLRNLGLFSVQERLLRSDLIKYEAIFFSKPVGNDDYVPKV